MELHDAMPSALVQVLERDPGALLCIKLSLLHHCSKNDLHKSLYRSLVTPKTTVSVFSHVILRHYGGKWNLWMSSRGKGRWQPPQQWDLSPSCSPRGLPQSGEDKDGDHILAAWRCFRQGYDSQTPAGRSAGKFHLPRGREGTYRALVSLGPLLALQTCRELLVCAVGDLLHQLQPLLYLRTEQGRGPRVRRGQGGRGLDNPGTRLTPVSAETTSNAGEKRRGSQTWRCSANRVVKCLHVSPEKSH